MSQAKSHIAQIHPGVEEIYRGRKCITKDDQGNKSDDRWAKAAKDELGQQTTRGSNDLGCLTVSHLHGAFL
ncbi:hypothetical protein L6452_31058 [Arctium lappa]|uniref:Uncharacterized protein n=1 Tax=Arctium lappa TaxID=4217 RepID=A0ACB8ZJF1_ARCLA|nr:hypothetical protein L6452_31058 [Arctium lappa]